jgi:hypothetical protein
MDFSETAELALSPSALATLVYAKLGGSEHYLYGGLLLIPLALVGLRKSPILAPALALLIPVVWFSIGPAGGLYTLFMLLPGFSNVRAPINIWFVVAFALALLAAAGFSAVLDRWNLRYLAIGIPLLLFADLYYWNSAANSLAYQRASWSETYGAGLQLFRDRIGSRQPDLTRFHAPYATATFGPLNHPLDTRTETTYGYNPLELSRYFGYLDHASRNPKLLNTLGVSRVLDPKAGSIRQNPAAALPRAHFPPAVLSAADETEARERLETLDPASAAVVMGVDPPQQDPNATAGITAFTDSSYRIRCRTASASLLRIAIPRYPGWIATVDGNPAPVLAADYALMGVIVPAGEHEVEISFRTPYFNAALAITCLALLGAAIFLVLRRRAY